MKAKYLLDTNICIYFIKNLYPELTKRILSYSPDQLAISSITWFELEYGADKSKWGQKNRDNLKLFLSPFTILPFDNHDADVAGHIRYDLEKCGNLIGAYDILIAAQGISKGLTVVTHNTGEFSRIPNIALEDWVD